MKEDLDLAARAFRLRSRHLSRTAAEDEEDFRLEQALALASLRFLIFLLSLAVTAFCLDAFVDLTDIDLNSEINCLPSINGEELFFDSSLTSLSAVAVAIAFKSVVVTSQHFAAIAMVRSAAKKVKD